MATPSLLPKIGAASTVSAVSAVSAASAVPAKAVKSTSASITTAPASYEAALQELEQLAAQLETGQLPLDQLMSGYQRGAELLTFCKSKLAAVEQQISVIDGDQLKPWAQE